MLNDEHQPITDTIPVVVKVPTDVQDGDVLVVNGVEKSLTKADADKEITVDVPRDSDQNKDKPNDDFDVVASIKRGDKESPKAEASQPYDTDGDDVIDATDTDDDGDGVNDADEAAVETDPKLWDTDGDGKSDGEIDTDGDGVTNAQESDQNSPEITDKDNDGKSDLVVPNVDQPNITSTSDGNTTVKPGENNKAMTITYYPESTATGAEHGQEVGTAPSATAGDPTTLEIVKGDDGKWQSENGATLPDGVTLDHDTGVVTFEPNSTLGGTNITATGKIDTYESEEVTVEASIDTPAANQWYLFSASEVQNVRDGNSEWLKDYFTTGQGKDFTGDNGDIIVSGSRDWTETLIISIENGETLTLKPFETSDRPDELSNIHTRWLVVDENGNIDVAKTQQYIKDAPGSTTDPSIHNRFILKGENLENGQKVSAWATNDLGLDKPANEGSWDSETSYTVTADKSRIWTGNELYENGLSFSEATSGVDTTSSQFSTGASNDIIRLYNETTPSDRQVSGGAGVYRVGTSISTDGGKDEMYIEGTISRHSQGVKDSEGRAYITINMGDDDDVLVVEGVRTSENAGSSIHNSEVIMGRGDDSVSLAGCVVHKNPSGVGAIELTEHSYLDGGEGYDSLTFTGSNVYQSMQVSDGNNQAIGNGKTPNAVGQSGNYIKGFEVIDLGDHSNTLGNLNFKAVQDNAAEGGLHINGGSSDKVYLGTNGGSATSQTDSTGGDWINQGTETIDGVSYVRWHNSAATDDSLDVLIQSGIQVL